MRVRNLEGWSVVDASLLARPGANGRDLSSTRRGLLGRGGRVVRLVMQRILVFSACHRIVVDVWHTVGFRHVYRVVVIWIVDVGWV